MSRAEGLHPTTPGTETVVAGSKILIRRIADLIINRDVMTIVVRLSLAFAARTVAASVWEAILSPAADPERKRETATRVQEARERTKQLSWGGILSALGWLFLCLAFYFSHSSLFLRGLAVFTLLLAELRLGQVGALLVFAATSGLALIFPGLYSLLPYLIYLAPYVLLAFFLTSLWESRWTTISRLILGCLLFLLLVSIYGDSFLPQTWREKIGNYYWPVMILGGLIGTAVYDFLLGFATRFYRQNLESYFKNRR